MAVSQSWTASVCTGDVERSLSLACGEASLSREENRSAWSCVCVCVCVCQMKARVRQVQAVVQPSFYLELVGYEIMTIGDVLLLLQGSSLYGDSAKKKILKIP